MFDALLARVLKEIEAVKLLVQTNEQLRAAIARHAAGELDLGLVGMAGLAGTAPEVVEWRLYDHCAAITRLYAIYEQYVEDLLTDWLARLPLLVENYSDLDENFRSNHLSRTGFLLSRSSHTRFPSFSIPDAVAALQSCLSGAKPYQIVPEGLVYHEQNLRKAALESLFGAVALKDAWSFISHHRDLTTFLRDVRADEETLESELNRFVSYRNDASHGSVDDVLGDSSLLQICEFAAALCTAITEMITANLLAISEARGRARVIGRVTEEFKKHSAVVALLGPAKLSVGDSLYVRGRGQCRAVRVLDMQIKGISCDACEVFQATEVGLMLGPGVREGLELVTAEGGAVSFTHFG